MKSLNSRSAVAAQMKRRIGYSDLFVGDPADFASYFQGCGKQELLAAMSILINAAQPNGNVSSGIDFLHQWLGDYNETMREELIAKLSGNDEIVNIISSLDLAEYIARNTFDEEHTINVQDFEANLLKAYLQLNDRQKSIEEAGYNSLPAEEDSFDERMVALILAMNFHDHDLRNFDTLTVLGTQIYKSVTFFKYLEGRIELRPHLNFFFQMHSVDNWQDWLRQSLAAVMPVIAQPSRAFNDLVVVNDENFDRNVQFLDLLCTSNISKQSDYITLRSFPLVKVEPGRYRVLSSLFLMEKLFKSIQFLFSLYINNSIPKAQRIKDFKADHCDKFSEQTILYQVLSRCFPRKWIHITGTKFNELGYSGEPDYYIRFKNKLFLFESKDVFLTGEQKQSRDYAILSKALEEKFYRLPSDQGGFHNKAVLQLIENIERICQKHYKVDTEYQSDNLNIYPIIAVHDRQFDSLGVNKLIQIWFKQEVAQRTNITAHIYDLTVINIDTLIMYHELFCQRGKLRIEDLIERYHSYVHVLKENCKSLREFEIKTQNSFIPFSHFVEMEVDRLKARKFPGFVIKYARNAFPDV